MWLYWFYLCRKQCEFHVCLKYVRSRWSCLCCFVAIFFFFFFLKLSVFKIMKEQICLLVFFQESALESESMLVDKQRLYHKLFQQKVNQSKLLWTLQTWTLENKSVFTIFPALNVLQVVKGALCSFGGK